MIRKKGIVVGHRTLLRETNSPRAHMIRKGGKVVGDAFYFVKQTVPGAHMNRKRGNVLGRAFYGTAFSRILWHFGAFRG